MFHEEFYPTPPEVADRMIDIILPKMKGRRTSILDPEAGKGDLLDRVKERLKSLYSYGDNTVKYYSIEINEELCFILQEKGYGILARDFLTYRPNHYFDFILMNPPFSNGDDHLLHAWEVLKEGEIVCLLNQETYQNAFTAKRRLLKKIINDNGTVTNLGACFENAERKTKVRVVMVHLVKKAAKDDFDIFEGMTKKEPKSVEFNEEVLNNQLAKANAIESLVDYYNESIKAYMDFYKARKRLYFYMDPLRYRDGYESFDACFKAALEAKTAQEGFNGFIDELRVVAWRKIFADTKITGLLTAKVRENFEKFSKAQGASDFTVENIENLFNLLMMNRGTIMQQCVENVFDEMCRYDKANKVHWEGWKTNDTYKVNKKVILPYFVSFETKYTSDKFSLNTWRRYGILNDFDKVMSHLSGKKNKIITIENALQERFNALGYIGRNHEFDNEVESEFFKIRFFKKGTLHLFFKDEDLWMRFNIAAAKGKNWLPAND